MGRHNPASPSLIYHTGGNSRRFLTTVLERVQAEINVVSGILGIEYAENAAVLVDLLHIERSSIDRCPGGLECGFKVAVSGVEFSAILKEVRDGEKAN